jgi:hypothetical protein
MIIRREHNGNFTIVPNAIFNDRRLSIEAIGILGYLLSRPPNCRARHRHLRKTLRIGRQRFERAIGELMSAGYAERDTEQPRDLGNQFSSYNYVIRDFPSGRSPDPPLSAFPLRGSRCRKPDNGNKNESYKTDSNKTPSKPPPIEQAALPLVADEGLTEFGMAAQSAGQTFVFEKSEPYRAWIDFAGEDRLPIADVVTSGGVATRGVWMPSLYPPTARGA